jgi:formamidopyrimidine-DNA glycosylase
MVMPELPDLTLYVEALTSRLVGRRLDGCILRSPFVLRSVEPPLESLRGATVVGLRRLGKRIVLCFPDQVFLVLHLMIAGRLRWRDHGAPLGIRRTLLLAEFEFEQGRLIFTEAGTTKRASLQVVRGEDTLAVMSRGGLEPLDATLEEFREVLGRESHTLKRSLTDPRLFSGIGNAYSDEILHRARLSPLKLTRSLGPDEIARLYDAMRATLLDWTDRLRVRSSGKFPETVTAFHDDMAVHGRFRQPCPVCGAPVQRIVYADNECNYCARCQTGGRLLADRSLSRLLRSDWPRRLDDP